MAEDLSLRPAFVDDLPVLRDLMAPFVADGRLLERDDAELLRLIHNSFLLERDSGSGTPQPIGCAALEVYSPKFSEVQCLAVHGDDEQRSGHRLLINQCVQRAQFLDVWEVISVTSDEELFRTCGFDYVLPTQKRAFFARPAELEPPPTPPQSGDGWDIRKPTPEEVPLVHALTETFVKQQTLLPRSVRELTPLFESGFVAIESGTIVGCCALEVYSHRLAEVVCLAVAPGTQGRGYGRRLVSTCLHEAKLRGVREVLAISASEDFFHSCGFSYALPDQKKVLILQTRDEH